LGRDRKVSGHLMDIKKLRTSSRAPAEQISAERLLANCIRRHPLNGDGSGLIMDQTRTSHLSTEDNSVITMKLRRGFREYRG